MIYFNKYNLINYLILESSLINDTSKIKKESKESTILKNLELKRLELLELFFEENPDIDYDKLGDNITNNIFYDFDNIKTNDNFNKSDLNFLGFNDLKNLNSKIDSNFLESQINNFNNYNLKKTSYLIRYFNLKSEILRLFIFMYFYSYVFQPFDPILFTGVIKNRFNFNINLLLLYDNYDLNRLFSKV